MATDTKSILSALLFLLFPLPLNRNLVTEATYIHKHAFVYFTLKTARMHCSFTTRHRTLDKKDLNNKVLLLRNQTDRKLFVATTSINDDMEFIFPSLNEDFLPISHAPPNVDYGFILWHECGKFDTILLDLAPTVGHKKII